MHFLAQTYDPATDPAVNAAVGAFFIAWIVALLVMAPFWWWAFISACSKSSTIWERADQSKVLWIVLILVGGIIGAGAYLIAIRPKLLRAEKEMLAAPPVYPPSPAPTAVAASVPGASESI